MSAEASTNSPAGVRLRRTLTLWNLIIIGIVIIQPIAPMGIYGVINNAAGGHVVTTILVALIAMFFTAISYGKMARVYPQRGVRLYLCRTGDTFWLGVLDRLGDGDGLHPEPAHLHNYLRQAHAEHPSRGSLLGSSHFLCGIFHFPQFRWSEDLCADQ